MRRAELEKEIQRIVRRLTKIAEEDRAIVQPQSSEPILIPLDQLLAYGRRYDERQQLHAELTRLASEHIED